MFRRPLFSSCPERADQHTLAQHLSGTEVVDVVVGGGGGVERWNNGGHVSSWSFHRVTVGSNGSSSSGTIASTAYTSNVSGPSTISMDAALSFLSLEEAVEQEPEVEETEEHIRSLVKEFFSAPASSANCSTKRGDMSVVERWLAELGVGWVLSLHDGAGAGASAGEELDRDARTWIRALYQIVRTIRFTRTFFPGLPNCHHAAERCIPDRYHLALFIQETMSKILSFVDVAIVAWDRDSTTEEIVSMDQVIPAPYSKLISMLGVHGALSAASYKILTRINTSVQLQKIATEMDNLLSAYKNKLGEAIRSTMEKIRTMSMEDGDDSSSPQGSSDIHKVTRSVMMYIKFLCTNYSLVDAAICDKYVPHIENIRPLNSMTIEMVSCLQEKLANIAKSISDQGLRFLFLLNNSYFIQEFQYFYCLKQPMLPVDFNYQTEDHMERYLQASWAPLLSCLFNPTPLCLGKNYSPLSKFESEFEKIYITQKQWKVPDPELRTRLRDAITDKIIPDYKEYMDDHKATNPKISPVELQMMLQDLFEG